MREYTTARTIFGILEFIAWAAVIGGVIFALVGASATTGFSRSSAGLLGALPGMWIAFVGILAVATVQFFRAGVDTAEMTGKMLKIAEQQLKIAKGESVADFSSISTSKAGPKSASGTGTATMTSSVLGPGQDQNGGATHAATPEIEVPSKIAYKSHQIERTGDEIRVGPLTFATLEEARSHIDDKLERAYAQEGGPTVKRLASTPNRRPPNGSV